MIKRYTSSSAILILFTILALICANTALKEFYFALWENPISVSIGEFNLFSHNGHEMSLMAVINDFLMAIFFLSVGLEIKREILVGELSSPQKALLPIIGACGGMIIPILCFLILCPNDPQMLRGAAIPMATDIAFSLGVLSIFSKRVPLGLKVFLAALAVADDLGGIIVIALFYSTNIDTTYIALSLICIVILAIGNIRRVRAKSFYLLVGLALWYTMLNSGIHATIAGVIVAFFVPASLRNHRYTTLSACVRTSTVCRRTMLPESTILLY
jgi:NhaA family Na+:H+ antiporter